jgi:hypothetical protein
VYLHFTQLYTYCTFYKEKVIKTKTLFYPLDNTHPTYKAQVPLPPNARISHIQLTYMLICIFLGHVAQCPFTFSTKGCVFHTVAFSVHKILTFYIKGVLKFKCPVLLPQGYNTVYKYN